MDRINFLTENPVVSGIQRAQQMEAAQARADLARMQMDQAREGQRQERAAGEALNRIYARGGNLSSVDVQRQLAADPSLAGSRRLQALQQAEEADRQRTQVEAQAQERNARAFKMYLETGLDAAAAETARKMGLNIPPSFWTDQAQRRALLNRLEVQEKQARINQSNSAAGANRARAQTRTPDDYDEYTDAEGRLVRVKKADGKASFVMGPDGQPLRTTSRDTQRLDVARDTNQTRLKIAELQARARTETGAARDATMREIARIQAESREAVALGNQGAALSRTEVQQQGATERNTETNATRESVARGNQGAALNRVEVQQEGADRRAEAGNASREAVALGNQGAALSRTEVQRDVAETNAQARAQGGGATGRRSDREVRFEMAKRYGLSDQEAAGVAAGVTMTPGQRAAINERIQRGVANEAGPTGRKTFDTPEKQQAEIARRRADVFGEQPAAPQGQQPQGAPATPGQSADIPRGPDGKVDHRQLVDGQVYLIPLKQGGQTTGRWNAQTGRFDEVN